MPQKKKKLETLTKTGWYPAEFINQLRVGRKVRVKLGLSEKYDDGIVTHQNNVRVIIELGVSLEDYCLATDSNEHPSFVNFSSSRGQVAVGKLWGSQQVNLSCVQFYFDEKEEREWQKRLDSKKPKVDMRPSFMRIEDIAKLRDKFQDEEI